MAYFGVLLNNVLSCTSVFVDYSSGSICKFCISLICYLVISLLPFCSHNVLGKTGLTQPAQYECLLGSKYWLTSLGVGRSLQLCSSTVGLKLTKDPNGHSFPLLQPKLGSFAFSCFRISLLFLVLLTFCIPNRTSHPNFIST